VLSERSFKNYAVYDHAGKLRYRSSPGVETEYFYVSGELLAKREMTTTGSDNPGSANSPSGLRATTFSPTAAEWYWAAASDSNHGGSATQYELYVDGEKVETTSNSSSYWMANHLVAGQTHQLEIIAVYSNGVRSAKAGPVTLTMPASDSVTDEVSSTVTVTDQTINWPDDGWYQVQRASDHSNVCEGGRSCTVEPGDYDVINHTTGERTRVSVAPHSSGNPIIDGDDGGSSPGDSNPMANGPTQLSATVFSATAAEWFWNAASDSRHGGAAKEYELYVDGVKVKTTGNNSSYWMANHLAAGQSHRLEIVALYSDGGRSAKVGPVNIEMQAAEPDIGAAVEPGPTPSNTSGVVVNGTTISWPDDGWYQVQQAGDYQTVCEGGRSCTVNPGEYVVINHATNERTEVSVQGAPLNGIEVNGTVISWPNDGWYQIQRTSDYSTVCEGGRTCSVSVDEYVVINHNTGKRTIVVVQ